MDRSPPGSPSASTSPEQPLCDPGSTPAVSQSGFPRLKLVSATTLRGLASALSPPYRHGGNFRGPGILPSHGVQGLGLATAGLQFRIQACGAGFLPAVASP